jgi:hypothetical protein
MRILGHACPLREHWGFSTSVFQCLLMNAPLDE